MILPLFVCRLCFRFRSFVAYVTSDIPPLSLRVVPQIQHWTPHLRSDMVSDAEEQLEVL